MKKSVQLFFAVLLSTQLPAQNFTGQWKGQFTDKSTTFVGWSGNRCDYVLEIECSGNLVTGYSYTYFNEGGKKYYTICKLKGTLNKAGKSIEVTEFERTKSNVPSNIRNCFQVHRLTYFKQNEEQTLEGTWVPAPNQEGDCGYGITTLTRRVLQKTPALYNNSNTLTAKPVTKGVDKTTNLKNTKDPIVKITPKKVVPAPIVKDNVVKNDIIKSQPLPVKKDPSSAEVQKIEILPPVKKDPEQRQNPGINFEKRNTALIKTIDLVSETFRVDLYDNGEIDGDSISLFFNGNLLLSHKRLSDKAISLTLNVNENMDVNELIMFAENLGSIPPNTALMVVTDGPNRYEVFMSSDLQKNASIRFTHNHKKGQ